MQPLIRLRALASQLKENELQTLIQRIVHKLGAETVLSFMFNHFIFEYNKTKQHHHDLSNMINIISDILNSRKQRAITDHNTNALNNTLSDITIDSMPSEMIGECASYLETKEYLSFSKCNRKIYIGCNSPSRLQTLLTYNHSKYLVQSDLNQFPSLRALGLTIATFNQYIHSHSTQNTFHQLQDLYVFNKYKNNHKDIEQFMNIHCINQQNITHLNCSGFGGKRASYDFNSFCTFLSGFSNITHLVLNRIYLTAFNDNIGNILQDLTVFSVRETVSESVDLLRNTLLNIYSQQIVSLEYDESNVNIDVISFPLLKELCVNDPDIDSLQSIIGNTHYLERLQLLIPTESEKVFSDIKMRNLIVSLFTKCDRLENMQFVSDYTNIRQIIKFTEIGLFCTINMKRKQMTLVFTMQKGDDDNIDIDEVNLCVSRIINALHSSKIDHFMLGVHIDAQNDKGFDENMERFKHKHLLYIYNDSHSVILSNKGCKINGYRARWINGK